MITIHTHSDIDRTAWSAFVKTHSYGTVFHTPEMYDVYARTENVQPIVVAAEENGEIVGLLLAQYITNGNALTSWLTARSIITGGPLAKDNDSKIIEALFAAYRKQLPIKTIYSEIRPVYDIKDLMSEGAKELREWKRKGHYNIVLNVGRSEEKLWNGMHKERRRNVGQAEKAGLRFEEVVTDTERKKVIALLQQTYRRKHVPIADSSLFEHLTEIMPEMVRFFACYTADGTMIAGQIRLCYGSLVYAWFAGSDEAYFKLRPNDFTMWNVIRWAHEQGYKEFDFGGGGEPGVEYGVRDYKLKYGCEMYDYGRYTLAHRPVTLWAGTVAYKLYHKIKGK